MECVPEADQTVKGVRRGRGKAGEECQEFSGEFGRARGGFFAVQICLARLVDSRTKVQVPHYHIHCRARRHPGMSTDALLQGPPWTKLAENNNPRDRRRGRCSVVCTRHAEDDTVLEKRL